MALGSRVNVGNVPDYIGMGERAEQSGMNTANAISGLMSKGFDLGSKMEDRERMKAARDAFGSAWNSDNPEDVQRVMAAFPEYASKIQQLIGIRDDQHRQDVGSMAVNLSGLLEGGNIQGSQDYIQHHKYLFDKSGLYSADSVASAIGQAANDPQKLEGWKNWAQKLIRASLNPMEIATEKDKELQRAETERRDTQAHEDRIRGQNISQENARYRANHPLLRRGGADHTKGLRGKELAEYIVNNGVMPDNSRPTAADLDWAERSTGLKKTTGSKGGGGGGFGGGNGQPSASENLLHHDIDFLDALSNSSPDSLSPLVGFTGSIGELPTGADAASKYREANGDSDAPKAYAAVKRIQGAMRNRGIADAKNMGASGINTEAEARMFFEGMPQLDFSSLESLQGSLMDISDYVNNYVPEDQGGGDLSTDDQSLVDKYYQGE